MALSEEMASIIFDVVFPLFRKREMPPFPQVNETDSKPSVVCLSSTSPD